MAYQSFVIHLSHQIFVMISHRFIFVIRVCTLIT